MGNNIAAHLDKYCTEWNNSLEFHHILHSRLGIFIKMFMFLTVNTKEKKTPWNASDLGLKAGKPHVTALCKE